jgi:hypothetical protein
LICKANQKAPWRLCNTKNGSFQQALQIAEISTDKRFEQSVNPIGSTQMHKSDSDG